MAVANLTIRFIVELCGLVAAAYRGFHVSSDGTTQIATSPAKWQA